MPQLDPSSYASQIFWLIIAFLMLYILLANFTVPKLRNIIQGRHDALADYVNRAEDAKMEAQRLEDEYNSRIQEAHNQAKQIIEAMVSSIKTETVDTITQLDERIALKLKEAEAKIASTRKELDKDLDKTAAAVASTIIKKLTDVSMQDTHLQTVVSNIRKNNSSEAV